MKRAISLLLALVLALGLAACGGRSFEETMRGVAEKMESALSGAGETIGSGVDALGDKLNSATGASGGASEAEAVFARADERRAAILSGETAIVKGDEYIMGETYSGAAYYVSNHGSDENDGLSPETPFATMAPFHGEGRIELRYGDAVFFERGCVWRALEVPGEVRDVKGLTLSAYGTGDKPAFYGSEENGAGAEKWSLYYEGDGRKIWKFHKELTEVSAVVLDGEMVAPRDIAWWDGAAYRVTDAGTMSASDERYDVRTHLENLQCFPELALPAESVGKRNGYVFWDWDEERGEKIFYRGPLYLRCDAGNPGELYADIEFIEAYSFVDGFAAEQTYDSLCVRCYATPFQNGYNGESPTRGGAIQNCEFGWIGGALGHYGTAAEAAADRWRLFYRDTPALQILGSGYTIRGNYVHGAYSEGLLIDVPDGAEGLSDIAITGNLVEYCPWGLRLANGQAATFRNVAVEDNMILYSGENSYRSENFEPGDNNALILADYPEYARFENVVIRGNVFAVSTGPLIRFYRYDEENHKVFSGNTYIQNNAGALDGDVWYRRERGVALDGLGSEELVAAMRLLGDGEAVIYFI